MAATAGSPYQALLIQHTAGNPPDCDPQRSSETYNSYVLRMQSHACLPDIGATESDSAYLARVGVYTSSIPVTKQICWGALTVSASALAGTSSNNCAISRISAGQYGVIFGSTVYDPATSTYTLNPIALATSPNYIISFDGYSGSLAPTASWCCGYNKTLSNFTMSVGIETTGIVNADVVSGSFKVDSI